MIKFRSSLTFKGCRLEEPLSVKRMMTRDVEVVMCSCVPHMPCIQCLTFSPVPHFVLSHFSFISFFLQLTPNPLTYQSQTSLPRNSLDETARKSSHYRSAWSDRTKNERTRPITDI